MKSLNHVHLSVDVDGFDQSLTPATGIPCQAGLLSEDVAEIIALIKQPKSVVCRCGRSESTKSWGASNHSVCARLAPLIPDRTVVKNPQMK